MSRIIKIGNVEIGGNNPIVIQSMTNTKTADVNATISQIRALSSAGCGIVRVSVPDFESIKSLKEIVKNVKIPIVADIHFDYRLAIESIKAGASKIRINPGNIGADWKVREVVRVAKEYGVPIRVGANSGSIKKGYTHLQKAEALAESALEEVRILESMGFDRIVISAKSSSVMETIEANVYIHSKVDYPLHIGVTEAGVGESAIVKSSIGIGALLIRGIGDTIRVSMAGDPIKEVLIAREILKSLGMLKGPQVIACPTCARTEIEVEVLAKEVTEWLEGIDEELTVAVMGCVVNGIGEGKHADIGVTGTKDQAVIFIKGKIVEQVEKGKLKERFFFHLENLLGRKKT